MKARPYAEETYARLSHRERELIKLNGGIDSAAEQTRVGPALIGCYHNAFIVDEMPVDVVADLEKGLDRPIVSRELVRMLGYEVVKLPEGRWPMMAASPAMNAASTSCARKSPTCNRLGRHGPCPPADRV